MIMITSIFLPMICLMENKCPNSTAITIKEGSHTNGKIQHSNIWLIKSKCLKTNGADNNPHHGNGNSKGKDVSMPATTWAV